MLMVYIIIWISGIITSLHGIGNHHNELAWQNDWITGIISAYEERHGRWSDSDDSE